MNLNKQNIMFCLLAVTYRIWRGWGQGSRGKFRRLSGAADEFPSAALPPSPPNLTTPHKPSKHLIYSHVPQIILAISPPFRYNELDN